MHKLTFFAGVILVGLTLVFASPSFGGCPVRFAMGDLKPIPEANRNSIQIYRMTSHQSASGDQKPKRSWQTVNFQLDPFDQENLLEVPSQGTANLFASPVSTTDRLAFEKDQFGLKAESEDGFPCPAPALHEIANPLIPGQFVYVAACQKTPPILRPKDQVRYLPEQNKIVTDFYEYSYFPANELLYQSMRVKHPQTGQYVGAGSKSGYKLYLDVDNFFDLQFGAHEFLTRNEHTHVGPIGGVARIALLKRFLGMKLDLKLITIASFYQNSANVPMVVDLPVQAKRWLNPGSGMLANWIPDESKVDFNHPDTNFTFVDTKTIRAGHEALVNRGQELCTKGDANYCLFTFRGTIQDLPFAVAMNVPKSMIDAGFFPSFVKDIDQFKKDLGWDSDPEPLPPGSIGMYFDNSGLPKGRYEIDYWIQLGDVADHPCPHPAQQAQVIRTPAVIKKVSH